MRKHLYIGIENIMLSNAQRSTVLDVIRALGPGDAEPMPHLRNHWAIRPDNNAMIFEANFEESNITLSQFKKYLADAFSISASTISTATRNTQYGRLHTLSRSGVDYLRIILLGGSGASLEDSRQAAKDYLRDNRAEWEEPE